MYSPSGIWSEHGRVIRPHTAQCIFGDDACLRVEVLGYGALLCSLVDSTEWSVGAAVQGATLYLGILDWMTAMRPDCSIPGALKSWLAMKPTFYCSIQLSMLPHPACRSKMNQLPASSPSLEFSAFCSLAHGRRGRGPL